MLYREPSARISLFDNSDVIVTSFDGVVCNFSTTNQSVCNGRPNTDFAFCSELGIPGENACNARIGNGWECRENSFAHGDCGYIWNNEPCTGEGDQFSTNSSGNLF